MKVCELFKEESLDLDFIDSHFEGSYWEKASGFISDNWNRQIESFTPKMATWFTNILDDCVEKRIEG